MLCLCIICQVILYKNLLELWVLNFNQEGNSYIFYIKRTFYIIFQAVHGLMVPDTWSLTLFESGHTCHSGFWFLKLDMALMCWICGGQVLCKYWCLMVSNMNMSLFELSVLHKSVTPDVGCFIWPIGVHHYHAFLILWTSSYLL